MLRFIAILIISTAGFFLLAALPLQTRILSITVAFIIMFIFSLWTSRIRKDHAWSVLFGILGSFFGMGAAALIAHSSQFLLGDAGIGQAYTFAILLLFAYLGFILFHDNAHKISFGSGHAPGEMTEDNVNFSKYKILDTSAIIDGRILDIAPSGFLEGIFIIPKFVLHELQLISDSADSMKRQRGRRGMEIINKMQKSKDMIVQIMEKDYPEIRGVDLKLIALSKEINGIVVTTDFNLHKVAEIDNVKIFNLNKLAETLRPIVLPGEQFEIIIMKPGKDQNQGIGYLEDGTMVVVDGGNKFIGKRRRVEVTSIIQTESGRMIFAR